MPRDKDRKRIIRNRMKKTGESYTAARAYVISKPTPRQTSPPTATYSALSGVRDDAIVEKTGRTWQEWVGALDADNASALPHREIAALVHGKHGVGDWWAQTVTVGYERIKGLRERGQRRSGDYEVNKSKTVGAPVDVLFAAWSNSRARRRWLDGVEPVVRTATAPKSMRLQWPDGTIVVVGFTAKGAAKSAVAVQHTKIRDKAAAERAKKEWAEHLEALASLFEK